MGGGTKTFQRTGASGLDKWTKVIQAWILVKNGYWSCPAILFSFLKVKFLEFNFNFEWIKPGNKFSEEKKAGVEWVGVNYGHWIHI